MWSLALVAALAACADGTPLGVSVGPPSVAELRTATTDAAAAAIGPDGRIQLTAPTGGLQPGLSADDARAFASAWMVQFAPVMRSALERDHGGPLSPAELKSCGRVLYARSPFIAPGNEIPAPYRRAYGPWWLVTFCDAAQAPTVSVAVSAWATDLSLTGGKLMIPRISGNEFVAVGIPVGHVGEYPSPPESAVELAAQQSGERVSAVPELVMPPNTEGLPQEARWHMVLEAPAAFQTASGNVVGRDVFVSVPRLGTSKLVTMVASATQPSAINVTWTPLPKLGEPGESYVARARAQVESTPVVRRADTPIHLVPTSMVGGS